MCYIHGKGIQINFDDDFFKVSWKDFDPRLHILFDVKVKKKFSSWVDF